MNSRLFTLSIGAAVKCQLIKSVSDVNRGEAVNIEENLNKK